MQRLTNFFSKGLTPRSAFSKILTPAQQRFIAPATFDFDSFAEPDIFGDQPSSDPLGQRISDRPVEEPRFLEQVKQFYERAAPQTGIEDDHLKLIQSCQSVIRFNIPLRRDDGSLETITCYR